MRKQLFLLVMLAQGVAYADDIPIVTLTDVGPNQEVPTHRSFYVVGDAPATAENVQAVIVRRGQPGIFGGDADCHDVLADLRIEMTATSATDEDDSDDDSVPAIPARYDAGVHSAFEVFPRAEGDAREAEVLVTAAWRRSDDDARQYKVLVPHDREFFAAGYGYCMLVVATERAQEIDDGTLAQLIDRVARKVVACGDKSSCDDDALADFATQAERELASSRLVAAGPSGEAKALASRLADAARSELGTATGIVEVRDHLDDRWHDKAASFPRAMQPVWADTSADPFAQATATLLARNAGLLPQVRPAGKGNTVALFTTDGKLQARFLQVLDDGRSIRVAASKTPTGDQARLLSITTDSLAIADDLTLLDLVQLSRGNIRVDKDWMSLTALGDRFATLGLETWSADDTAYLATAHAHLKTLAHYVDSITAGVKCPTKPSSSDSEGDQGRDAAERHLGEWLVCAKIDPAAVLALADQLGELAYEDQAWHGTKQKLLAHARRLVTLTTTSPVGTRVAFSSRTWAFSYLTPMVGYAGVIRPDESFGMFYLGAQLHFVPNPVDEVLWRDGVTSHDLRRAIGIELGVAPYRGSFGPQARYSGPGGLPPIFLGLAVHLVPYTSLTLGGAIFARKNSTLMEEQPHTVFTPYVGFTVQLNVPDMFRQLARPTTDTEAFR